MQYNANLYLCRLRKLVSTELMKSGIMTVIFSIAGFCLGLYVTATGRLASPMLVGVMTVTICDVLYAASIGFTAIAVMQDEGPEGTTENLYPGITAFLEKGIKEHGLNLEITEDTD